MTRLRALLAVACLAASIASLFAADGPLDRAAAALGVDAIQSLEFEASGRYYQFGQAPAPELPWPAFDVTGYTATLDYARIAVHAKYRRVQVQEPGRARPHTDQTQDQYAAGGYSWNLTPAPTSIPTNLAERNAELWTSPQGFVKAARAHAAVVKPAPGGNATVTFTIDRRLPLRRARQRRGRRAPGAHVHGFAGHRRHADGVALLRVPRLRRRALPRPHRARHRRPALVRPDGDGRADQHRDGVRGAAGGRRGAGAGRDRREDAGAGARRALRHRHDPQQRGRRSGRRAGRRRGAAERATLGGRAREDPRAVPGPDDRGGDQHAHALRPRRRAAHLRGRRRPGDHPRPQRGLLRARLGGAAHDRPRSPRGVEAQAAVQDLHDEAGAARRRATRSRSTPSPAAATTTPSRWCSCPRPASSSRATPGRRRRRARPRRARSG